MDLTRFALVVVPLLLLAGIVASKVSDRFGIPALLLFLAVGMLAGSEGPGGIYFDDYVLAQFVGTVALVIILFNGGLSTEWSDVRGVAKEGLTLATLGVLLTALTLAACAHFVLRMPFLDALLLGSIVSSTDAAAVIAILRSKGVSLQDRMRSLLELESGSNDPMAVLLTVSAIRLITVPDTSVAELALRLPLQLLVGAGIGFACGKVIPRIVNRLRLYYEGLYPIFLLAAGLLTYGIADLAGGNGFIAVYVAGIVVNATEFIHKRSLLRFLDGLAWLMQIVVFVALGLLVFPSRLPGVALTGLAITAFLMFVARPVSVFVTLLPTRYNLREKVFISWVGLRGAVPVVLATYPLMAGVESGEVIFSSVFFIVLVSVLVQGTTIPPVARLMGVAAPMQPKRLYPIEYNPVQGLSSRLREIRLPADSPAVGRAIVDLHLPMEFLIVLIARDDEFVVPHGGITLQADDVLLALTSDELLAEAQARLGVGAKEEQTPVSVE